MNIRSLSWIQKKKLFYLGDDLIQKSADEDIIQRNLKVIPPEISHLDQHLTDDGSLFTNPNVDKLTKQVANLQEEIESKNKQISDKDSIIASLIECGILKDRELNDLRNRIYSIERDSCAAPNECSVSDFHFDG